MANASDANDIRGQLENEWQRLRDADIPESDREAIEAFVNHRKAHGAKGGSYATSTQKADLQNLRLASERAEVPLTEAGLDDANDLLNTLTAPTDEGGYGLTTGIDAYTRVLRPFWRWLDAHDDWASFGWWEQIRTGNVDFPEPGDREFPTQDHVEAMIAAARENQSPRDAAIVSYFADSAVRHSLGAQLLVGSLSLDGDRATFTPNPNGEMQKGVEPKPYPLYDSVADLRVWLRQYHPDAENPDAPLWTPDATEYAKRRDPDYCHKCREGGHDDAETCPECGEELADDGALSAYQIGRIIRKYADRAGLPEDVETKPHALRHAAVGRWKERGYSLPQVQRRTAWKDKAAAEMWGRYGDPDDDAIDAGIDEVEGQAPPESTEADAPTTPERFDCGNCGSTGIAGDYCPSCAAPVSPSARAEATEEADKRDTRTVARAIAAGVKVANEGEPADDISEEDVERIVSTIENDGHQGTAAYDALADE